jgi:hypothetical protein
VKGRKIGGLKMKVTVEVTETYKYQVEVDADSHGEALNKVKVDYDNSDPKYDGGISCKCYNHRKNHF